MADDDVKPVASLEAACTDMLGIVNRSWIPAGKCPPTMRRLVRHAFFMGAYAVYEIFQAASLPEANGLEEVARLNRLDAEFQAYFAEVKVKGFGDTDE